MTSCAFSVAGIRDFECFTHQSVNQYRPRSPDRRGSHWGMCICVLNDIKLSRQGLHLQVEGTGRKLQSYIHASQHVGAPILHCSEPALDAGVLREKHGVLSDRAAFV